MSSLIIDGKKATLSETEFTNFHGNSVFTTLRSFNGKLLLWQKHWQRLSCQAIFFGFSVPSEKIIRQLIINEVNGLKIDQKIRIIINQKKFAITCEPFSTPVSSIYQGVQIIISDYQVHPQLAPFKTGNSLPYFLARKQAISNKAFEAFLKNENGFVVDGSFTSIMMFDGQILTALEGGLLGCMREQALDYAIKKGIKISRAYIKQQELKGQLLLANSLLGIVPVGRINFDFIKDMVNHFRMDSLNQSAYDD
jgi:4-amino-4-deoxychorismate lyase